MDKATARLRVRSPVRMLVKKLLFTGLVAAVAGIAARRAGAQAHSLDLGWGIEVGGEAERYARVLQIAGMAGEQPWSIQPFTPAQLEAMLGEKSRKPHPWQQRFGGVAGGDSSSASYRLLAPQVRLIANSAYPYQVGGGPTWAGRGLTADAQAGIAGRWHMFYAEFAPIAFVAQNAAFALAPNGGAGRSQYADARFPSNIDAPQRFGNAAYSRLALGTTSLTFDGFGVAAGFTSAPSRWGPMREFPLVLGPNAGGFPRIFLGSDRPWNFWLFKAHARLIYGELGQSRFSPIDTGSGKRLGSGLIVVAQPRGVPGLEIGLARFLHRPWGDFSPAVLERPFSGIIYSGRGGLNEGIENQNASAFARWAFPGARAEFYGEYYKEDYPGTFHHATGNLVEQPDDYASYGLGFQHVLQMKEGRIRVLRGEVVNGESNHLQRLERGFGSPLPPYIHSEELQGHTYDGLILGSPEAYGGSGWRFGIDEFTPSGRRSLSFERSLRFDWLPTETSAAPIVHPDVIYGLRMEAVRFRGASTLGVTLIPAIDLNRNLVAGHNVFNLTAAISSRGW